MRGETFTGRADRVRRAISIHSPHTRGDAVRTAWPPRSPHFNPLPSHEGRLENCFCEFSKYIFQSAPLIRGETPLSTIPRETHLFQSTPLIRGETCSFDKAAELDGFQSTPLIRGETLALVFALPVLAISIHSPHARGDRSSSTLIKTPWNFNPLPSHEGRQARGRYPDVGDHISIHTPHTRGDDAGRTKRQHIAISIHSPHTRGDLAIKRCCLAVSAFQSTPLMRGETVILPSILYKSDFNPLPSCEGRLDKSAKNKPDRSLISIRSPHTRGDDVGDHGRGYRQYFNPLPSYEGRLS